MLGLLERELKKKNEWNKNTGKKQVYQICDFRIVSKKKKVEYTNSNRRIHDDWCRQVAVLRLLRRGNLGDDAFDHGFFNNITEIFAIRFLFLGFLARLYRRI